MWRPTQALRRALFRLTLPGSPRFDVEGVSVVYYFDAPDPASLNARLGAALALLRDVQPRRYRAVRPGFRHIILIAGGGESFNLSIRCCVLDAKYIAAAPTVRLAGISSTNPFMRDCCVGESRNRVATRTASRRLRCVRRSTSSRGSPIPKRW